MTIYGAGCMDPLMSVAYIYGTWFRGQSIQLKHKIVFFSFFLSFILKELGVSVLFLLMGIVSNLLIRSHVPPHIKLNADELKGLQAQHTVWN